MQIFATTLFTIFSVLICVVNGSEKYCLNQHERCSMWMVWPAGLPGLKPGTMALPKELTLYDKTCVVLETKMEQPEKKGLIMIKSSLAKPLNLTGSYPCGYGGGKPIFTYGTNE
ncbi:e96fb8e8-c3f7-4f35-b819-be089a6ede60 [Sclerotinia trifoliorum]|uniref:E96fb8e8-c3f7-4f35-b819-be089a6ede60 n=1 Tax=Sclerotinia trifoliorum TaxID=28548 RepID=A0A8H2W5R5_9HELO|nr:e96fb8e8-c3f7-4f35-b819-be089a6ede60 [Sclerotinia trifoliorum]